MTEEQALYQDRSYKNLKAACDRGDEAEIRGWYEQLAMGYGSGFLKKELGTVESLVKLHC